MKNKRLPIYFTAESGAEYVRLPLAKNRGMALFNRASYEDLMRLGYSSQMRLSSASDYKKAYVRSRHPELGECSLTRAITGALKSQHIHYRDGNRLNLTLENLVVVERGGGFSPKCPLCRPRSEYAESKSRSRKQKGMKKRKIPKISVRPLVGYHVAFTPPYPPSLLGGHSTRALSLSYVHSS